MLSLAIVVTVGASCSGERRPAATDAPTEPPAASIGTDIEDGQPCPPAPADLGLEERTGCVSVAMGTFEPGARAQRLISYALLDERGLPTEWRLRVTRDGGAPLDQRVGIGSPTSYPRVLGTADADRDGLDEAFVKVLTHLYHSGATHEVAIFGVARGRLFRVRVDAVPLRFPVGGISTFGEGAECRDIDLDGTPEFLLLRVDDAFGEFQRLSRRIYRWKDRSLEFVEREEDRMAKTGYADPLLYRYYSLRCFDFEPPFPYARG